MARPAFLAALLVSSAAALVGAPLPGALRRASRRAAPRLRAGSWHVGEARGDVDVDGVPCTMSSVAVTAELEYLVLEAGAEAQSDLVSLALAEHAGAVDRAGNVYDPYGAIMWPASVAVSRYLLAEVPLAGTTVLELGAGTGLVALVAADAGARVTATDYNSVPLRLLDASAAKQVLYNTTTPTCCCCHCRAYYARPALTTTSTTAAAALTTAARTTTN